MIKTMLRPLFKRFWGLFVSMTFVSMLSIGLLCAFASVFINLSHAYEAYISDAADIDAQVNLDFKTKDVFNNLKTEVPEVLNFDSRLSLDMLLEKRDGRKITARAYSYNETTDKIFSRRIYKSIPKSTQTGIYNVSVARKFSENNHFDLGTEFKVGFFDIYITAYVYEIVETPEGIYPRANDYIWSDNQDFGYLYVDSKTLNKALLDLGKQIQTKSDEDPDFLPQYRAKIDELRQMIPDISMLDNGTNYADMYCNQILVEAVEGVSEDDLLEKIETYFENHSLDIKSKTRGSDLPYRLYMTNSIRQVRIVSTFLPVFFYSVTMIVITLFMNQIIKSMTTEIGILMSIGVDKKHIMSIYLIFSVFMSITAGLLGIGVGYGLNIGLTNLVDITYSMSMVSNMLNVWVVGIGIAALVLFSTLATLFSCTNIFRITPKDATISNESKRKRLPERLERFIDKAPLNIKLATNTIAQNPRRFFVSSFAIFASYVLILLTCFFYVSKNQLMNQTVNWRLNFDCQVYLSTRDDSLAPKVEAYTDSVAEVDECYYTYLPVTSQGHTDKIFLECLALPDDCELVNIPDASGKGSLPVPTSGIILPASDAKRLKVSKGSTITMNNHEVVVSELSNQYFHPIVYLNKAEMVEIAGSSLVTSLLVDITDEELFLNHINEDAVQCLTVFTDSLSRDLRNVYNALDTFIVILIGFSLGMAFVILSIMSQNALLETKRSVSIFRAIGFTVGNISNMWTLTSAVQLLLASIFAIPAGSLAAILLFNMASSATQVYPFILDWRVILIGFAFILAVVFVCHLISMFTVKRWNLADNLRCRE